MCLGYAVVKLHTLSPLYEYKVEAECVRLAENLQVDCRSVISHVHASCNSSFVLDMCVWMAGVD